MEKLKVTFTQKHPTDQRFMHGTIRMVFECEGENCIKKSFEVWASYAFPPFNELIDFLETIFNNRFPAEFGVDTEGLVIKFTVNKSNKTGAIEFKLSPETYSKPNNNSQEIYFQGTFDQKDFLSEIINKYRFFLENDYNPYYWNEAIGGFITFERLEKLEKLLSRS